VPFVSSSTSFLIHSHVLLVFELLQECASAAFSLESMLFACALQGHLQPSVFTCVLICPLLKELSSAAFSLNSMSIVCALQGDL
jgi:hypothetical protein